MVNQLSLMFKKKFKNPPSLLVNFLVVQLNKIPLFPKDLITLRVIPEPLLNVSFH